MKCHLAVCSNDRVISFFNVHVDCRLENVHCIWCMFIVKIHLNVEFLVEVDVNKRIHILKWTLGRLCVNSGRIHQHDHHQHQHGLAIIYHDESNDGFDDSNDDLDGGF